mgnify:CR=1 FL=1|jgi:bifunctional UDP-N-acetylglucosamine pyrophosphorylase/glucosamine-1-phosphate N-acetyltransferase
MQLEKTTAVILAAGEGKRMQSALPKVLHPICGYPMISYVISAVKGICSDIVVVVGHQGEKIRQLVGNRVRYVEQKEQLGTAHAVLQAVPLLPAEGNVLVLCGDTPLLTAEAIGNMADRHSQAGAAATVLTAHVPDPYGYGRIVRDEKGGVAGIVEEKDATAGERKITEINTGTYVFDIRSLKEVIDEVGCSNVQGEYYLTDCIAILQQKGLPVAAEVLEDYTLALGVNDRMQLARVQSLMQQRINNSLMEAGVTLVDPQTSYIDAGVRIGRDTVVMPNTIIRGRTVVGENCIIGPNSELVDCRVGSNSVFRHSVANSSEIGDGVAVGPFAHLRSGTVLEKDVKVGGFVEIKKTRVGSKTKIAHLSYIGDAQLGSGINMGGGTIVVNYDGKRKNLTTIHDNAFIGCNCNLVAPVTVGKGAYVAAGSTVTEDVPAGSLTIARARQVNKEGRAARYLENNNSKNMNRKE